MDLGTLDLTYLALAALLIGFTKTSVGGVGILAVLLVALAVPGKASPGFMLPMLIAADIMAVLYYRRSCQWHILIRLMPAAAVGVVFGFAILWALPDANFEKVIGWIILAMFALDIGLNEALKRHARGKVATSIVGVLAGASSMVANAAGPIFGVYLLQMGLDKNQFVGTRSWYFLVMNLIKLPFAITLGIITPQSLSMNAVFLPVIILGAVLGFVFLKYLNISMFKLLIRIAVVFAAARLILF